MATKTKATKDDRARDRFVTKVQVLHGLLRVAADLAGEIDDGRCPGDFDGMDRELHAVICALPVFADALGSYGPTSYSLNTDRPVADRLASVAAVLRSAEGKGVSRG